MKTIKFNNTEIYNERNYATNEERLVVLKELILEAQESRNYTIAQELKDELWKIMES